MNKKTLVIAIFLILTLILITNVLAITASIGNARMILRAETGDVIEKSIRVINNNDVAVNIILTASGDLQDSITIKDKNFTLEPSEEKNAFFTIKITKTGTTESKINVQFTPVDGKNGAGLSSTIVVIASGEGLNEDDNGADNNSDETENNSSSASTSTSITGKISVGEIDKKVLVAILSTGITLIAFIVLLVVYYTKVKKENKIILKINNKNTINNFNQKRKKEKIKQKKRVKKRG